MTKKSRLGQGLGALFPDIPGDSVAPDKEPERPRTVGTDDISDRDSSSPKRTQTENSKRNHNRDHNDGHRSNVSRETSSAIASSQAKASRRRSIPALSTIVHPSDVFFGASAENVIGVGMDQPTDADRSVPTQGSRVAAEFAAGQTLSADGKKEHGPKSMPAPSDIMPGGSEMHAGDAGSSEAVNRLGTDDDQEDAAHGRGHDVARESRHASAAESDGSSHMNDGVSRSRGNPTQQVYADRSTADENPGLRTVKGGYLAELSVSEIVANAQQPRTIFDEEDLRELADSIKQVGVLQPVVVRKKSTTNVSQPDVDDVSRETSSTVYELIMGERRWRATRLAGLTTIPAIVKTTTDDNMLRDALLENLHRVELNPLEEAAAFQQMMEDFGLTQAELSESVSLSRPQISNILRLLKLPPTIQKQVASGVLSSGHARALLALSSTEEMESLANRIVSEGLSVRSTEEIVSIQTGTAAIKPTRKRSNPWESSEERHRLENRLDTKVTITGSPKHGKIHIVFSSQEDMERIMNLLDPSNQATGSSRGDGWV